jgi:cysteinyl-tRNA synthetase
MALKVYNTLSRKKERFEPIKKGSVRMYVCGPTVYDYPHLGHARTYIAFDVIRNYLEYKGYSVLYVQNITDVGHLTEDEAREDKIIAKAKREHVHPMEIAELYTKEYFDAMDALGVRRPSISPRATGHIIEIQNATKKLVDKGLAYVADGDVYFDVSKFKDYGKLSNQSLENLEHGVRVVVRENKRSPLDFALWKKAEKGHILQWSSPWREGFPGWHIECSVMSAKYLGEQFDIHGGACDLVFPHHENEIAQSEALTGKKPFVKYWLHTGFLNVEGEKMSKSLGNFITVRDALAKHEPEVVRLFMVSTHYRSPMDFSEKNLKQARASLDRLRNTLDLIDDAPQKQPGKKGLDKATNKAKEDFTKAMDDDFNSPVALSVLFEFSKQINTYIQKGGSDRRTLENAKKTLLELAGIFGILRGRKKKETDLTEDAIKVLIDLRNEYRKAKDFKKADEIRVKLESLGIQLDDKGDGTTSWKASR